MGERTRLGPCNRFNGFVRIRSRSPKIREISVSGAITKKSGIIFESVTKVTGFVDLYTVKEPHVTLATM